MNDIFVLISLNKLKGTKLYSIFKGKCPKCHEGNFFEGSFFKGTPKKNCSTCNMKFEREPGFFQGSYYVTYGLGVATIVSVTVAMLVLFPNATFNSMMYTVLVSLVVLTPFTYPLSKIIWSNIFTKYDKALKISNEKKAGKV